MHAFVLICLSIKLTQKCFLRLKNISKFSAQFLSIHAQTCNRQLTCQDLLTSIVFSSNFNMNNLKAMYEYRKTLSY